MDARVKLAIGKAVEELIDLHADPEYGPQKPITAINVNRDYGFVTRDNPRPESWALSLTLEGGGLFQYFIYVDENGRTETDG